MASSKKTFSGIKAEINKGLSSQYDYTILIVDDDPASIGAIRDYMQIHGFEIMVASDGELGIERAIQDQPDIILLDIRMPGIDGFETCRRLKTNPATKEIPVIFLSAMGDTDDIIRGFEVGGGDYITKPLKSAEILARINTQLKIRNLTRELETTCRDQERRIEKRTAELDQANRELKAQIFERYQNEALINLRWELLQYATTHSLEELYPRALDWVEALTQSKISFFHFINPDQKTLLLQAWSTRTTTQFCIAKAKVEHYTLDQAGVWVDCVHKRRPVIHNDYASLPHKKGMPEGHARVIRELVVPIFRDEKIVAILGIGNKESDYTQDDVKTAIYCGDVVWEISERKQAEEDRRAQIHFLETLEQINDAIGEGTTIDGVLKAMMETTLSAFDCDRAWVFPVDSPYDMIQLASADKAEYPGMASPGADLKPPGPGEQKEYGELLESDNPISYVCGTERPVINENALGHQVKSQLVMALRPKIGGFCVFGLHQCSHARVWTKSEEELFSQIGQRVGDYLNSWFSHMDLQKSEERFRAVANYTYDWETWFNAEGIAEWINPAVERVTGYSVQECLSMQDYPLPMVYEKDRPVVADIVKEAQLGSSGNDKPFRVKKKSGSIRWVAISWQSIFNKEGKSLGYRSSIRDITDRKRAEQELKKYQEHLEELVNERTAELAGAKKQAEAANAAKSDFLARMSHEIRTPLNAVTGLTNILLKSELTAEQRDYLNKVQLAGGNLLQVINDILDFSKVEAGRLDLERHPFDLDQLMEQLADLFGEQVAKKDVELIFARNPDVPRLLMGDGPRLVQVLINLVTNAVKFTDAGEIVVRVALDDESKKRAGWTALKFSVSDTGIGINADDLATLFEPFTQIDSSLTRKYQGTGLGLAICRRLVELMGGRIWAESNPDHGTTFCFTVVLEDHKEEKSALVLPADLHGLKALAVDDSTTARQVLVDLLESFTFNVSAVDSGEKAIDAIKQAAADDPYQLVLMDWKMPGVDGIEAAKRIRELEFKAQPEIPVVGSRSQHTDHRSPITDHRSSLPIIILVTAFGRELIQERVDTSTAVDSVLLKPVKSSQLLNTIMGLLGQAETMEPRHVQAPAPSLLRRWAGRRVLVVEDSALNLDVAVALLQEVSLTVETVQNGQDAVDKVTGLPKDYYSVVLMDIQMPVMDGYEATRCIREWEVKTQPTDERPSIPVNRLPIIALTAHALKGEKEKCLAADMDDYLAKPIDEQELHRVLRRWIVS